MKIAIIGGGWVGCHLAYKLKEKHDVILYEKNEFLFEETSYNNQNRLHLGFHYPRNYNTRHMCKNTFNRFIQDYGFLTKNVNKNFYCVPNTKSFIDFKTYQEIFKVDNEEKIDGFNNIEGCINTDERYINFDSANRFFNNELKNIFVRKQLTKKEIKLLSKQYDLVIDATNNQIQKYQKNSFFEPTITLLYRKINDTPFDAITLVDGQFFSIYPYVNDMYTLTDVEYTPIKKIKTLKSLKSFYESHTSSLVDKKKNVIEEKVLQYYPNFLKDFIFSGYFLSTKTKIESGSDSRYPVINKVKNVVHCFTGKIQGIYIIEDYINNLIKTYQ